MINPASASPQRGQFVGSFEDRLSVFGLLDDLGVTVDDRKLVSKVVTEDAIEDLKPSDKLL